MRGAGAGKSRDFSPWKTLGLGQALPNVVSKQKSKNSEKPKIVCPTYQEFIFLNSNVGIKD